MVYCQAICTFILETDEAIKCAIEDIVKLVEKLIPFLVYQKDQKDTSLQDMVVHSLLKICQEDQYSLDALVKYINLYGEIVHDKQNTTLNHEISNYKSKKLADLISVK